MTDTSPPEKLVGALSAGLKVLRYLASSSAAHGVSRIAKDLDLNASTCFNLLKTLVHERLVTFDESTKTYSIALGLVELAKGSLEKASYVRLMRPHLQELAARMHALLRRQGGRADPLMRHGEVLLNPVTREVLRAGMPVKLSGREFAVLHALLARPGKVWSIAQLQDNLYGWDEEVGSNTVEVYIHALRKKLGSHFIQNIRGVGYVIPREAPTSPAEPAGDDAHQ